MVRTIVCDCDCDCDCDCLSLLPRDVELWLKCCAKLDCVTYYLGLPLKVLLENTFVVLTVLTVAAPAPAVP